jgi:hypothetical protein
MPIRSQSAGRGAQHATKELKRAGAQIWMNNKGRATNTKLRKIEITKVQKTGRIWKSSKERKKKKKHSVPARIVCELASPLAIYS